jgi:deoxyribodipyrimidine photo-lyase
MSRDQRVDENHAFNYAQSIALNHNIPLKVVFNLVPTFLGATMRQYGFMINGLKEVEIKLREKQIPFKLLTGNPIDNLSKYVVEQNAMILITDFSPIKICLSWVDGVAAKLDLVESPKVPLVQIDAHNVVPCWHASSKLEYSARTIRSKIQIKLPEFLDEFIAPNNNPEDGLKDYNPVNWDEAIASLDVNHEVKEVDWLLPGEVAANETFKTFYETKLKDYGEKRNDPTLNCVSNLSPYLHFGQISVQKMVMFLKNYKKFASSTDSFIEEIIVRRELADNFCYCIDFSFLFYSIIILILNNNNNYNISE